jgi:hypothetical protein
VLRADLARATFTPWAASMFGPDPCTATQLEAARWFDIYLGTDGFLWTFNHQGLLRFEGAAWTKQPFPDRAAGWPNPQLIFDEAGLAWVTRTEQHFAWHRSGAGFAPVRMSADLDLSLWGDAAPTPRGSLFLSTQTGVVELTEDEVIEYPPVPREETRYGVETVASDAYGRPIAGADYRGWTRYRFEAGAWHKLFTAELLANDAQFRVYVASSGKVWRLEADHPIPVGPQVAHRSLSGPRPTGLYDLSMAGGPHLHWLMDGPYEEQQRHVTVQETALRGEVWSTQGARLEVTSDQAGCRSFARKALLRRHGNRTLLGCADAFATLVEGEKATRATFSNASNSAHFSDDALASTQLADGRLALAYWADGDDALDQPLHLAEVDPSAQVSRDQIVPAAIVRGTHWLPQEARLQLVPTGQGLVLLWLDFESESSEITAHAKLLRDRGWQDLPDVPRGKAFVDGAGALWISATHEPGLWPTRWTGSGWEPVAGGAVAGMLAGTMAFDRADNPIVTVAAEPMGIGVLRHIAGAWQPVNDSMRPGGVTTGLCTGARSPRLAIEGNQLCLSWLESVASPFELLLRCTELPL